MKNIKIVGLPVIVSKCYRIVLDKSMRTLFQIRKDDLIRMCETDGFLQIMSLNGLYGTNKSGTSSAFFAPGVEQVKQISAARFNLPRNWAKKHGIRIGGYVYLIATDTGILICPENLELVCFGGMNE